LPTTLRDVAREAGVSIRTVSRVVNEKSEIADDTKARVLAAIDKLDYRPNALARGLVSGKTSTIGVVIPEISDPFFPEFVQGVESVARAEGYSVFLCNTDENADLELKSIEVLAANQVDGMILCGSYLSTEQLQDVSARYNIAIVTSRTPRSAAVVSIPGRDGLEQITAHLIRLGHLRIGFVGTDIPERQERYLGYASALQAAGLPVDPCDRASTRIVNVETARQSAIGLLTQRPGLTAVACYNDLAAVGVLQACRDLGRRVPDDLAITGFDDIPLASLVTPALTTIRVPRHSLGEKVMDLLLRVMAAGKGYAERQETPIQLIVRDSCGGRQAADADGAKI
jgi:LacI family transcriptional regulator